MLFFKVVDPYKYSRVMFEIVSITMIQIKILKMAVKEDLGPKIEIFFLNSSELVPDYKNAFFQGCRPLKV